MPYTGQLYDIYQYCAAANAASLGGYSDWRVCNSKELDSIRDVSSNDTAPDATAFPSWPGGSGGWIWTSTTSGPGHSGYGLVIRGYYGYAGEKEKTDAYFVALVRGGR